MQIIVLQIAIGDPSRSSVLLSLSITQSQELGGGGAEALNRASTETPIARRSPPPKIPRHRMEGSASFGGFGLFGGGAVNDPEVQTELENNANYYNQPGMVL